jgi:PAS domain S-box-containing protein
LPRPNAASGGIGQRLAAEGNVSEKTASERVVDDARARATSPVGQEQGFGGEGQSGSRVPFHSGEGQSGSGDPFHHGDGELANLLRSLDWSTTPVGSPETWSDEVRVAVSTCLDIVEDALKRKADMQEARADAALQESEERYRTLLESIEQGFCVMEILFDSDGEPIDYRFLETNAPFERHTGLVDAVGKTARELVSGLERHWIDIYARVAISGKSERFVQESQAMGRWFEVDAFRIGGPERRRVALLFTDITGRKRAEEALRRSEEEYRRLFNSIDEGFCVIEKVEGRPGDPLDYRYVQANPAFAVQSGVKDVLGKTIRQVVSGEAEEWLETYDKVLRTGEAIRFERDLVTPGRVLELYAFRVEDGTNRRVGVIFTDITERKTAQRRIEEETARLQAIIDTIPVGLFIVGAKGEVTLANQVASRMWAGTPVVNGMGDYAQYKGYCPETGEPLKTEEWPAAQAILHGRTTSGILVDVERFDGTRGTMIFSAAPIRDPAGRSIGAVVAIQDVSELKRTKEELATANRRLQEADRRKDEFLAMLAHELRNPLAAITSAVGLMERQGVDGARLARAREVAARQARQMTRLVDDLLDVSRITQGKVTLKRETVSLADVVHGASEAARPGMEASAHRLFIALSHEPLHVNGDPVRIVQMVANLLSNAAKYTPRGGEILLTVERRGDEAAIRVRDNGIGIPADLLPHVFDLFVQGQPGQREGLGIGLTMVKRLAELHGGRVEARSDGPRLGSEFTIWLPVTAVSHGQGDERGDASAPGAMRILVVDDNRDAAELLGMLLETDGHQVQVAHDGRTALLLSVEHRPDVVLLDIGMPVMDGFELAHRLRSEPALEGTLLVAITGYGRDDDRERTRAAGFDEHLVKPVDISALRDLLRSDRRR